MAAWELALRLGTSGAKRSPGCRSAPAGTLRELPVSNPGREPEQTRSPQGLQTCETSCRNGSNIDTRRNTASGPAVNRQPRVECQTANRLLRSPTSSDKAGQWSIRGPAAEGDPAHPSILWGRCVRTCPIRLPVPYEPTRQPIPKPRLVGRLPVAQRSWSGGSRMDSVRRIGATWAARSRPAIPEPGPSSIPCRQSP